MVNMRNIEFNKRCNLEKLTGELKAAGFKLHGASGEAGPGYYKTTIHLTDTEEKEPAEIVNAHKYTEPIKSKSELEKLEDILVEKGILTADDVVDLNESVRA